MKLVITFAFIVLDFTTGLVKAFKEKSFNSSIMREGLYHKSGEIILIILGLLGDYAQRYVDIGITVPITASICVYIILMEIGSIAENVGKINPKLIPEKIKPFFHKLKEGDNER